MVAVKRKVLRLRFYKYMSCCVMKKQDGTKIAKRVEKTEEQQFPADFCVFLKTLLAAVLI